ncbi:cell surface protein, partial [Moraxella catarrhalis]
SENTQNIEDLAAYNELQDAYAKQQTEAIDALNKASSENTQNIEDLAAYNELQDAYAKQQTEAIDALNKA